MGGQVQSKRGRAALGDPASARKILEAYQKEAEALSLSLNQLVMETQRCEQEIAVRRNVGAVAACTHVDGGVLCVAWWWVTEGSAGVATAAAESFHATERPSAEIPTIRHAANAHQYHA